MFFSPFSITITSLWEERANLSAFLTFVRFVLVSFCLFSDCGNLWTVLFSFLSLFILFFCACLDLSVSSSSWGLGRAAVCDCGTPWTFLLPFYSIAITWLGEERQLILVRSVCLFDLCLFGFVGFLFLFVSGKGCGL